MSFSQWIIIGLPKLKCQLASYRALQFSLSCFIFSLIFKAHNHLLKAFIILWLLSLVSLHLPTVFNIHWMLNAKHILPNKTFFYIVSCHFYPNPRRQLTILLVLSNFHVFTQNISFRVLKKCYIPGKMFPKEIPSNLKYCTEMSGIPKSLLSSCH